MPLSLDEAAEDLYDHLDSLKITDRVTVGIRKGGLVAFTKGTDIKSIPKVWDRYKVTTRYI